MWFLNPSLDSNNHGFWPRINQPGVIFGSLQRSFPPGETLEKMCNKYLGFDVDLNENRTYSIINEGVLFVKQL